MPNLETLKLELNCCCCENNSSVYRPLSRSFRDLEEIRRSTCSSLMLLDGLCLTFDRVFENFDGWGKFGDIPWTISDGKKGALLSLFRVSLQ